MKLSVIIPAYNEEKNIRRTLKNLKKNLEKFSYDWEVVVVCDGCTDQTAFLARKVESPKIKIVEYYPNQGKGHALTTGVKESQGEVVTFFDAGGDFHPDHIDRYIKLMEALRADIVIGSKRHPMSIVNYPWYRRAFYSFPYQVAIRLLFNLKVRDTQAGIKVFRRQVLEKILPLVLVKKYAFDLELLVLANHLGFHKITEAPVELNYNFDGGTSLKLCSILNALKDTSAIFYRLRILRYYDRKLREKRKNV